MAVDGYHGIKNKTKVWGKGVDTPEIKTECEQQRVLVRGAKQHTVKLLREAR